LEPVRPGTALERPGEGHRSEGEGRQPPVSRGDGGRGNRYLAVAPSRRRGGVGRRLMEEAERLLRAEGCPKVNLQVRTSNREVLAFYEAIGFSCDDVLSLGKRLVEDLPGGATNPRS